MGHQEKMRVHFHVVFLIYGTPAETPEELAVKLRREIWKRWERLNKGVNRTGNLLKIQTKPKGLWYLLTNHLRVGKTTKEKGKPNWYGIRNKGLIEANGIPVTSADVRAKFDEFFPMLKAVAKKPKREFSDRRKLAGLKAYVEAQGKYNWEDFKRMQTGRKRKVNDADFINFLNAQNGWSPVMPDDDENTL